MAAQMPDKAEVGRRIRERREKLGLSQPELGDKIGRRGQQVWKYEDGRNLPGPEVLVSLAQALEVSESWLLYGESAMQPDTRVERDDAFPELLAYRGDMERAGTPIAPEHWDKLKTWRRATGPAEREEIIGYHRGMIAAAARKALERPIIDVEIETDRGQRPLPPIKRRR